MQYQIKMVYVVAASNEIDAFRKLEQVQRQGDISTYKVFSTIQSFLDADTQAELE